MLLTLPGLRAGYVTRYLNEPLAWGLTPESMQAFFVQRQCWAKGAMQILRFRLTERGVDGLEGAGFEAGQVGGEALCQRHDPPCAAAQLRDASYSLVNRLWLAQMQTPAVRPDDMGKAEAAPKAKLAPAKRLILPTWMGTDDAGINA
jgi:cellulose synthase/poly-beta-1,6-N-acetylglucosamine synthase-like glycosyltransferase